MLSPTTLNPGQAFINVRILVTRTSLCLATILIGLLPFIAVAGQAERIIIESDGWELIGDLQIPQAKTAVPAVLMLNQAAGNRAPYESLAAELAGLGIASLRLDLRAHGESTNLGAFNPRAITDEDRESMIRQADTDVIAAHRYLQSHPALDPARIAIVGASYSGEAMAAAGRKTTYVRAYVALSPGSFSDESVAEMDESGASWLFIVSKNERFMTDIVANVHEKTKSVEILYLPGDEHATDILDSRPDMAARIAAWLDEAIVE